MNTFERVAESLRIEGIDRPPTEEEIAEHHRFMRLDLLSAHLGAHFRVISGGGHGF